MNKQQIIQNVQKVIDVYNRGLIPQEHNHEVNPGLDLGSRKNYLYFTLPVCLNYQRSSPAMWKAALETYEDPATNYLFFPEEVVKRDREEVMSHLLKHKLGLQKNRHTDIWIRISDTLHKQYNADPREILKENAHDVAKILNTIRKDKKKDFPYLAGPKMSHYWLFILRRFTDVQLNGVEQLSIIPDTHIQQTSVHLGVTEEGTHPEKVSEAWFDLLDGTEIYPVDLHPIFWNWSRAGFKPEIS